ncbi:MAG: aminoacyl--tRNA ligase-related protein [bacterium]
MYQSKLFVKTRKEAPKDEVSKNAQLLIKAGFINKEMAGVYSFLPLGLRVLNNINNIIRDEMNKLGGQEIFLTSLQEKENWEKTNRWSDEAVDFWFKTKLKNDTELGLAATHEEPLTALMKNHIRSYKDLPAYPYQIQTKFRNETRAKSGIMRCREFLMKDMYSFSRDIAEHEAFYNKSKIAYKNIFNRLGIGEKTYITFASGGSFSKYSHEFQTVSDAGEDLIYICDKCKVAVNKEIIAEQNKCPECGNADLKEEKAIETGNIFSLGTKFSDALDLTYPDINGEKHKVVMGCYGIGPGRAMGTVVETLSDDKGLVWPVELAPFKVHLIQIGDKDDVKKASENLYEELQKANIEVLFDDRDLRPGEKFADSDLFGIPLRIIVSEKTLMASEYEVKERASGKVSMKKEVDICDFVKKYK